MEQFFLVPDSVYNNESLYSQAVTKQELPKYQAEQQTRYWTNSLEKEIYSKLFLPKQTL